MHNGVEHWEHRGVTYLHDHRAMTRPAWLVVAACWISVLLLAHPAPASTGLPDPLAPMVAGPAFSTADFKRQAAVRPSLRFFSDADIAERLVGSIYDYDASPRRFCIYDGPGQPFVLTRENGYDNHRSFQGLWTDPVSGLSYARNRWYDARTASWLSEDPMGAVDSPNLYAFVGWGPQAGTDPMGLYQIPQDEMEAWKAAHPDYTFEELNRWIDEQHDAHAGAVPESDGWFSRKWTSFKSWYGDHIRFGRNAQAIDEARTAQEEAEKLRASYTSLDDENLRLQSEGRKTGIGDVGDSYSRVVIAGITTVVIVADDIGMLTGAAGLAKYGLREGMQVLIRRSDGVEELYRVIDDDLVRAYAHDAERAVNANLVARIQAKMSLYPKVVDPRTGRNILFPTAIKKRVGKEFRHTWDSSADRGAYIAEWYRRGYETPIGGWNKYDIHHIQPLEFGGTNDFWNLVPVERGTHRKEFNAFWREFDEL